MKRLFIILILIFAVGCQKKYTRTPAESQPPADDQVSEEVMTPAPVEEEVVETIVVEEDDIGEEELSIAEKAKSIFKDVLFDYDKYDIRPEARAVLDSVASFLNEERNLNIVIEGHCDERGTNEYNLALGEKRAKAAKKYLLARGISSARMLILTYGEEKPVCLSQNESCWQSNRRAHFVITQ
jgi:peptidoglycan-associated lipoprotein